MRSRNPKYAFTAEVGLLLWSKVAEDVDLYAFTAEVGLLLWSKVAEDVDLLWGEFVLC